MTTPRVEDVQAGLTGNPALVPGSQDNLVAVGNFRGIQLDMEGLTEVALRESKRNLREPEDGQEWGQALC